ncbi:hypothetical protein HF877_06200 [Rhodococcus sp. BL-253-APC-6A1W]|nr:hypothetical protein [Rhodococcus sp. BL-253-APC-6A1W]
MTGRGATDLAVFGSAVRGDAGPSSDIDLLITHPGSSMDRIRSCRWHRSHMN